jgi:hypothetical protein
MDGVASRLELTAAGLHPGVVAARYGVRTWLALVTVYLVWGSTFIALAIVRGDMTTYIA